jgi:hypothetical protein
MANWATKKIEIPRTEMRIVHDKVMVSISPACNGTPQNWQYIDVSLGEFSPTSMEDCQIYWPKRAIELARKALDDFEASLNEDEALDS